jgi:ABC-type multidrug transport system fused ATPase/permease subunit
MQKLSTEDKKPSPYDSASYLSFILYHWLTPLINLGAQKTLELDDVYNVPVTLRTSVLYKLFQFFWDEEQAAHQGSGAGNLAWMLIRASRKHAILSALYLSVMGLVTIVQPYFLVKILEYVAHGEVNFFGVTSGVGLAVGLAVLSLLGSLGGNVAFAYVTEYGCRTRSILIAKIFAKSLKISSFTRSQQTTGEIVTLMASDTERIWMFIMSSHWLWLAPTMIVVAMALLIVEFGLAAVIVTAVVGLWFAAFSKSSGLVGYYRSKIVKMTGERVKLMNEALQGIRVIKLYSWEIPTIERIEQIRKQETDIMMQYQMTKMFNTVRVPNEWCAVLHGNDRYVVLCFLCCCCLNQSNRLLLLF